MRSNPLVIEVLAGLSRQGSARHEYLGLLLLQAVVLILWWPKSGVADMLESQHGPHTLAAVVMAMGVTMAYFALRTGAEEVLLPGQHGLRDWAVATRLAPGRIIHGYVLGQLVHSFYLLALSSPLLLTAFTVSGGEWAALGWCIAAALVQALFYRLCGAITHLTIGQHGAESRVAVRAILLAGYVPIGWFAPFASHIAFTARALGESATVQPPATAQPDHGVFLALYAGLSVVAAIAVHRLLLRQRGGSKGSGDETGVGEVVPG